MNCVTELCDLQPFSSGAALNLVIGS